ncbi:MAG TPA: hypothetical protein PLP33_27100 [Leptospiraceae bacterium]|nr:hypothetical protein [Leptospiraceae bacterium]
MSNALTLPDGVDKLSNAQKIIALPIGIGVIGFLGWLILPTLISILTLFWTAAVLALPIVYIAFNPMVVWGFFKSLSWHLTKSIIGLDLEASLDRYYDWVESEFQASVEVRNEISKGYEQTKLDIREREDSYNSNMERVAAAVKINNEAQKMIYGGNAQDDLDYIKEMTPVLNDEKERKEEMDRLVEAFGIKKEQLKHKTSLQKKKYQSLKRAHKGLSIFNKFISGNSEAARLHEETTKQLNAQIAGFTANIQNFRETIKPVLQSAEFDKEVRKQKVERLLAQFNQVDFTTENQTV